MKVEKKVTILLTEKEFDFLEDLKHAINTTVCEQYDSCADCPFWFGANGFAENACTGQKFFNGLNSISDYE